MIAQLVVWESAEVDRYPLKPESLEPPFPLNESAIIIPIPPFRLPVISSSFQTSNISGEYAMILRFETLDFQCQTHARRHLRWRRNFELRRRGLRRRGNVVDVAAQRDARLRLAPQQRRGGRPPDSAP